MRKVKDPIFPITVVLCVLLYTLYVGPILLRWGRMYPTDLLNDPAYKQFMISKRLFLQPAFLIIWPAMLTLLVWRAFYRKGPRRPFERIEKLGVVAVLTCAILGFVTLLLMRLYLQHL